MAKKKQKTFTWMSRGSWILVNKWGRHRLLQEVVVDVLVYLQFGIWKLSKYWWKQESQNSVTWWILFLLSFISVVTKYLHTVCRVQSNVWRLPKYWPPTPLSAQRVCPPPASIFWRTPDIGLTSYSIISLRCCCSGNDLFRIRTQIFKWFQSDPTQENYMLPMDCRRLGTSRK